MFMTLLLKSSSIFPSFNSAFSPFREAFIPVPKNFPLTIASYIVPVALMCIFPLPDIFIKGRGPSLKPITFCTGIKYLCA